MNMLRIISCVLAVTVTSVTWARGMSPEDPELGQYINLFGDRCFEQISLSGVESPEQYKEGWYAELENARLRYAKEFNLAVDDLVAGYVNESCHSYFVSSGIKKILMDKEAAKKAARLKQQRAEQAKKRAASNAAKLAKNKQKREVYMSLYDRGEFEQVEEQSRTDADIRECAKKIKGSRVANARDLYSQMLVEMVDKNDSFACENIKATHNIEELYYLEQEKIRIANIVSQCDQKLLEQVAEYTDVKHTQFTGTMNQVRLVESNLREMVCVMNRTGTVELKKDWIASGFTIKHNKPGTKLEAYFSKPSGANYYMITQINGKPVSYQSLATLYPQLMTMVYQEPQQ